ncbi:MAG: hypothetical protein V4517_22780 [Pseudomonadota bacterium]
MTGFLGFAPIYANGLLALVVVFVLPGILLVRPMDLPNAPQRWLAIFLGSMVFNHLFVTLIALLRLDPITCYRVAVTVMIGAVAGFAFKDRRSPQGHPSVGAAIVTPSDIRYALVGAVVLALAYFNIWKYGVPHIFGESDVSISWNRWALIWSQGLFPTFSYGYPQLIPTLWAVTYIFTGSNEHYFAYYIHVVLLIVPIVLTAMVLGRNNWGRPASLIFVFVWFVSEVREGWLRATLHEGFPDWVAAVCAFCGAALFINGKPGNRFDKDQIATALFSLCLLSFAAATKPIFGLFAVAVLAAICIDAAKHLDRRDRNRFCIAAIGLFAAIVTAYVLTYWHLAFRSMPHYPVSDLSERLSRALGLFNRNFTFLFRILAIAGLVISPFLPRVRWLALPLWISISVWANTASYDLRNVLGPLAICAFIPVYAVTPARATRRDVSGERRWIVPDAAMILGVATMSIALTLNLASGDAALKARFADDQLKEGSGREVNQKVGEILERGCTMLTGNAYLYTIAAFQPFKDQLQYSTFGQAIGDPSLAALREPKGCTGILYVPGRTHQSVLDFIAAASFRKVIETDSTVLLMSN